MNILKLQDELKSVPDNALVGYVQNPTGHVPSYLALSELQRRKDMREKYQQAQPEKTTVAEDLEQQAQPQPQGIAAMQQPAQAPVAEPGLAGLPVPDQMFMFSGQGMAAGGIVAFDDGGGRFFKDLYRQSPNPLFKLFSQLPNTRLWLMVAKLKVLLGLMVYVNPGLIGPYTRIITMVLR
jgi:hypothetical protein